MYPLKISPISVLFTLTMEGTDVFHDLPQQWLASLLPPQGALCARAAFQTPWACPSCPPTAARATARPAWRRCAWRRASTRRPCCSPPTCCPPPAAAPRPPPSPAPRAPRTSSPLQPRSTWRATRAYESGALPPVPCRGVNCSVAVPSGTSGATRDPHSWAASLAAFHAPLLFLCRCRFISPIYQHYLCLETLVKLFLSPPCPVHPRDTEKIVACSCTSQLPILCEMDGWKQHITSRCEFWGQEMHPGTSYSTTHNRGEGISKYIPIWPAIFWRHLTSTKPIPRNPGAREAQNRTKIFIIFFFFFLFSESETSHA